VRRRFPDDPRPWKLLDRQYLHRKPPWLVMRQDHLQLPGGGEIPEYFVTEFPPWANVVAVTADDQLVMVRQYRPAIEDVHFELPAGVVDPHDRDPETAARRELREETGFGGGRWSLLTTLSANPALQTNLTYSYLAEGVTREAEASTEATEDLRVHLVPVAEALALIDDGDVVQALHAAPLLRYLLSRGPSQGSSGR
jgi:8-oxo-dGTP pyrophosphatase MutT (NUDIX family)